MTLDCAQALLLALLVLPLPRSWQRAVVQLCDAVLFWQPHPHLPLSLFWVVLALSLLTFAAVAQDMWQLQLEYKKSKTDRNLIQLLAEERNAWIAGCCAVLWICVHRYRNLLKRYHRLLEEREDAEKVGAFVPPPQTPVTLLPSPDLDNSSTKKAN